MQISKKYIKLYIHFFAKYCIVQCKKHVSTKVVTMCNNAAVYVQSRAVEYAQCNVVTDI